MKKYSEQFDGQININMIVSDQTEKFLCKSLFKRTINRITIGVMPFLFEGSLVV